MIATHPTKQKNQAALEYALVNGVKVKPTPMYGKMNPKCPHCGSDLIAKCGNIKIWHWAHKDTSKCDQWWDSNSDWQMNLRSKLVGSFKEIDYSVLTECKIKSIREWHIVDIYSPAFDIKIKLQDNKLSDSIRMQRESFYDRLIWVVNCSDKRFEVEKQVVDDWIKNIPIYLDNYTIIPSQYERMTGLKLDAHDRNIIHQVINKGSKRVFTVKGLCLRWKWGSPVWLNSNKPILFDLFNCKIIHKRNKYNYETNSKVYVEDEVSVTDLLKNTDLEYAASDEYLWMFHSFVKPKESTWISVIPVAIKDVPKIFTDRLYNNAFFAMSNNERLDQWWLKNEF